MRGRYIAAIVLGLALGGATSFGLLWWFDVAAESLVRRLEPRPVTTILGMHRMDPQIGYELLPGAVLRHTTREFDVEYHIDGDGGRRVPGGDSGGPRVDVYGDSWTFGHGVADDETFAAVLQRRRPAWWVRNRGVMGYGTVHAMLSLERDLARDGPPDAIVYAFNPIHVIRNHLRDTHVKHVAGGRTPAYDVVKGRLHSRGLLGAEHAIPSGTPGLARAEITRTRLYLRRMAALARNAGVRFVVVLLDGPQRISGWNDSNERVAGLCRRNEIEFHDLTRRSNEAPDSEAYFDDDHPTASWHATTGAEIDGIFAAESRPRGPRFP